MSAARRPPPQKATESGSIVLSARAVAIELLEAVLKRRKPLDEALAEHPDLDRLVNRDRQFVRALVTCTLRHLGQIDHVLAQCLEKPLPARASAIRNILRLGTAQTLFLKTPAHAAVDTMVTLAGKRGGEAGYKGLVNAVLRRIAREAELFRQFAPGSGNFTGAISLPDWLWQSWVKAYGVAKATQIAIAHLDEPPLDFTVRRDPDHWAKMLGGAVLPSGTVRRAAHAPDNYRPSPRIEDLPGFAEGMWWVQDLGASLPAKLLGNLTGKRALDMCAAPGRQVGADGAGRRAGHCARPLAQAPGARGGEHDAAALRGRLRCGRRRDVAEGQGLRRGAAGRALHRHRHHPPPSRCRVAQGPGRRRETVRQPGRADRRRGAPGARGRHHPLFHLLAAARGRPRPHRRRIEAPPIAGAHADPR